MADLHAICLQSVNAATAKAAADIDATVAKFKAELTANQAQITKIMESFPAKADTIEYIDKATAAQMHNLCPNKATAFNATAFITNPMEYVICSYEVSNVSRGSDNRNKSVSIIMTNLGKIFHRIGNGYSEPNSYTLLVDHNIIIPKSFDCRLLNKLYVNANGPYDHTSIVAVSDAFEIYCKGIKNNARATIAIYDAETQKLKDQQAAAAADAITLKKKYDDLTAALRKETADLHTAKKAEYNKLTAALRKETADLHTAIDSTHKKQDARTKLLDNKSAELDKLAETLAAARKQLDIEIEENKKMRSRLDTRAAGFDMRESLSDISERVIKMANEIIAANDMFDYDAPSATAKVHQLLAAAGKFKYPMASAVAVAATAIAAEEPAPVYVVGDIYNDDISAISKDGGDY